MQTIKVSIFSIALVALYCWAAILWLPPEYQPGWWDTIGTVTGLACVILTRLENNWCWPLGIISSVAMSVFFWNIDLMGQWGLQLLFFTPVQLYGWYEWLYGGPHKDGVEIETSDNKFSEYPFVLGLILSGTLGISAVIEWFNPVSQYPLWDSSIVISSIIAQFYLSWKRIEAWWLWLIPVNISSIVLFFSTGAWLFGALYIVFLGNAALAIWEWYRKRTMRRWIEKPL